MTGQTPKTDPPDATAANHMSSQLPESGPFRSAFQSRVVGLTEKRDSYPAQLSGGQHGRTDTADVTLSLQPYPTLGPDQTVSICSGAPAVDLTALFPLSGLTTAWTLNGGSISNATAAAASSSCVYQVIAQTAAGCEDTALVYLTVLPGPALGPDHVIALIGNRHVPSGLLARIGRDARWVGRREVRRALVRHPRTPLAIAQLLLAGLAWTDLVEVPGDVRVPPALRRDAARTLQGRIAAMGVGEKIALARRAGAGLLRDLAATGDGRILRAINLKEFKILGKPLLLGTSRKSFIGKILNANVTERLEGTLSSIVVGVLNWRPYHPLP